MDGLFLVYFMENPSYKWMIWGYPYDLGILQIDHHDNLLRASQPSTTVDAVPAVRGAISMSGFQLGG